MENLINMALIFIYPDGKVEKIPISNFPFHMDYMRENLEKSERFRELCGGLNFFTNLQDHIDSHLNLLGVIVIFNLDLYDIVKGDFEIDRNVPKLISLLPENLGSLEQVKCFETIYEVYPREKISFEMFVKDLDTYRKLSYEEMLGYINEAKENLGSSRK